MIIYHSRVSKQLKLPDDQIPYKTKSFKNRLDMLEFALKDNIIRRQLNLYTKCLIIDKFKDHAKEIKKWCGDEEKKEAGAKEGKISKGGDRPKKE